MTLFQKIKLSTLTISFLSFSLVGCQELLTKPTLVDVGSIVFTPTQFDTLLVKLQECVNKDSLIAIQDSIIINYQEVDKLQVPFWEQLWIKKLLYTILGAGITKTLDK